MDTGLAARYLNMLDEKNFRYTYGPPRIVGATSTGTNSGGDSLCNILIPTGALAGDAMWCVLFCEGGNDVHVASVPTGFQEITNNNDGFDVRGATYAKTLTSIDIAAGLVTFGFTGVDLTPRVRIGAFLMQECHTTDKRDDWLDNSTGTVVATTFDSLTSNVDNTLHVLFLFQDTVANHTPPSGYTEHVEWDFDFCTVSVAYKPIPVAGTATGVLNGSSSSAVRWLAQSVTVPPFPEDH